MEPEERKMALATTGERTYRSTQAGGLRTDSVPMRLFQKAKKLGIWDPADIDFSQDKEDWKNSTDIERDVILRLVSVFQAGEEAVTIDLLPMLMAVAREGRIEEEIYLTSFLWEEAKHTEFFRRWLDEVAGVSHDLSHYMTPSYRKLFLEELPESMGRIATDSSPAAMARASVTYNMIVEGMLAETGYYAFQTAVERSGKFKGILSGVRHTARDESRHIRFGLYLLQRLVSEDDSIWDVIMERMNELFPLALAITPEFFDAYGDQEMPYGLEMSEFVEYAANQFDRRMKVLERDRGKSFADMEAAVMAELAEAEAALAAVAS
jgi:ribonucleoside-diphosphate reductase beta chain